MMIEDFPEKDLESDRLIATFTNADAPALDRRRAGERLFKRHEDYVLALIKKRIFNPDDVIEIAQDAWITVLDPETLNKWYEKPSGKFRAYLRNPINWAIMKHLEKLPYRVNEEGEKTFISYTGLDEQLIDQALSDHGISEMIETTIKPNLKNLSLKIRNVYMLNEHDVIFNQLPGLTEIADINGISEKHASDLLDSAAAKSAARDCDDAEFSVHAPVNYDRIVDREQLHRNTTSYLSELMGLSASAYRKRLHEGRRFLVDAARAELLPENGEEVHRGPV